MAAFARVNGDYQPVAVYDAPVYNNSAVNSVTSGATVQPQGPKLEFLTVTFTGTGTSTTQINNTFQTITQLATIHMYEFTTDTNDTLALAIYPVGAWGDVTATGAGTLDQAITDAIGENVSIAASATFTG